MRPSWLNMMAFCSEHPKWDQNPKFTPLSEMTSIPPFHVRIPPAPPGLDVWSQEGFQKGVQILHVTVICASGLVTSTFSVSVCIVPLFSAIIGFIGLLALEVCNQHWRERSKGKLISSWFEQCHTDFGLKAENVWLENHDIVSRHNPLFRKCTTFLAIVVLLVQK